MKEINESIVSCLPPDSPTIALPDTYTYVSRLRWPFRIQKTPQIEEMCEFIDSKLGEVTLGEKTLLMMAPIPWREPAAVDVIAQFCGQYRNNLQVDLIEGLKSGPLAHLLDVELCMKQGPPSSSHQSLGILEGMHKLLVFYMWMQMRSPVAWSNHAEVADLKERTELALDWCLQGVSWGDRSKEFPNIALLRQKSNAEKIAFYGRKDVHARREAKRNEYQHINAEFSRRR